MTRERRPEGLNEWETLDWCIENAMKLVPAPKRPGYKLDKPCMIADRNLVSGYAVVEVKHKNYRLHRLALARSKGMEYADIPKLVRHKCGNKPCFEPEHLTLGTWKENAQDTLNHGRKGGRNRADAYGDMGTKFDLKIYLTAIAQVSSLAMLRVSPDLPGSHLVDHESDAVFELIPDPPDAVLELLTEA